MDTRSRYEEDKQLRRLRGRGWCLWIRDERVPGAIAARGEGKGFGWYGDIVGEGDNGQAIVGLRLHFEFRNNETQLLSIKQRDVETMSLDGSGSQFATRQDNVIKHIREGGRPLHL